MLTSKFLPGNGSTLWDSQANSINHDSTFAAFFVKEKAVQITAIYNYQRGHRGS